jgi:hypothetical protein
MTLERIWKNGAQNRLDLRDLRVGICCADFAASRHWRFRKRCGAGRGSDPIGAETVPAGGVVRERRFFFFKNPFVLCLPCARNPITDVPAVLTNAEDPSVTGDQAFAGLACQVVHPDAGRVHHSLASSGWRNESDR